MGSASASERSGRPIDPRGSIGLCTCGERTRRGFSIIELITVLVVVGVVAAITIPAYGGAIARYRLSQAKARLMSDIELARATAQGESRDKTIVFDPSANSYVIADVAPLSMIAPTVLDAGSVQIRVELDEEPYSVDLSAVLLTGGSMSVTFDAYGRANRTGVVRIEAGAMRVLVDIEP